MIMYHISNSNLGAILVAENEKGICAVDLGYDKEALIKSLKLSNPQDTIIASDNKAFKKKVKDIIEHVNTGQKLDNIALDIRGTEFQKLVWKHLQSISRGETISYKGLAEKMNKEKSHRAIANACAANKLAVLIPCHRVVKENGDISDYRWGIDIKEKLLSLEKN